MYLSCRMINVSPLIYIYEKRSRCGHIAIDITNDIMTPPIMKYETIHLRMFLNRNHVVCLRTLDPEVFIVVTVSWFELLNRACIDTTEAESVTSILIVPSSMSGH